MDYRTKAQPRAIDTTKIWRQAAVNPIISMTPVEEIEPLELRARLDRGERLEVLDVRQPEEIAIASFPRALHIPMGDIPSRLTELDPDAHLGRRMPSWDSQRTGGDVSCAYGFRAGREPGGWNRRMVADGGSRNSPLLAWTICNKCKE